MKVTKSIINDTLSSLDRTAIYKLAKQCGIDVTKKHKVYEFVNANAKTTKVLNAAYDIAYGKRFRPYAGNKGRTHSRLIEVIQYAKYQKAQGFNNYSKVLIEGNNNIYWASPEYRHSDYNKSIAFANTEENKRISRLINSFLKFS